jgi:protein-tyrosine phosphatase
MAGACIRSNVWMIDVMQHYLTNNLRATSEEIDYLKHLYALKSKPREDTQIKRQGARKPSLIIDSFLYHGDLGHAQNMNLLNELGIQHIINVCDFPLGKDIVEHFNVLWIHINDELGVDIRKHFETTNSFLHTCKQKGEKVLVHCQMGISRSSSIILAYLIK